MDKIYSADIINIITLCHIIDDFEEFEKRLFSVISTKYNRDFVFQLWDVSRGKFKLGARKAKKFYEENKSIIDIINKYSNVPMFINQNYSYHGVPSIDLQYFYKYLLNHKEDIKKILELLEKLKDLNFSKFEFNSELDFTKDTYKAYTSIDRNFSITYVANPQVIPNYVGSINYKTNHSNYKMQLALNGFRNKEFSQYSREITLNSLLFDMNTLPEKIDEEHIFKPLLEKKNEQEEKASLIRNSVDLSISILDLEQQFNSTSGIINRLNSVTNKEELVAVLSSIKGNVEKLKDLSTKYNSEISQQEPLLTPEVLENEKQKYLKRREWQNIDLC